MNYLSSKKLLTPLVVRKIYNIYVFNKSVLNIYSMEDTLKIQSELDMDSFLMKF